MTEITKSTEAKKDEMQVEKEKLESVQMVYEDYMRSVHQR